MNPLLFLVINELFDSSSSSSDDELEYAILLDQMMSDEDDDDDDSDSNIDIENDCPSQSEKRTNKTQCRWTAEQTQLLLSLYKKNCSQMEDGSISSCKFWSIIVEGMREQSYSFTSKQCSTKMDSLKRSYQKIKAGSTTDENSEEPCEFHEELEELFHEEPVAKPLSASRSNVPMKKKNECNGKGKNKRQRSSSEDSDGGIDWGKYVRESLERSHMRSAMRENRCNEKMEFLRESNEILGKQMQQLKEYNEKIEKFLKISE